MSSKREIVIDDEDASVLSCLKDGFLRLIFGKLNMFLFADLWILEASTLGL